MRMRLGITLLALVPLPFTAAPSQATEIARPAYINIVVESPQHRDQPPSWRVETLRLNQRDTTLSPQVSCDALWAPKQSFAVTCRPTPEPDIVLTDDVRISGRLCENPAVRAEIHGPIPNEQVTGLITCGEPVATSASCTASASTVDVLAGGYSGDCLAIAPNGPLPIRCWVDLSKVLIDRWSVTCYGTDP